MSLVAYDSSDDNSDDEEINFTECVVNGSEIKSLTKCVDNVLCLPDEKCKLNIEISNKEGSLSKVNWGTLPKPKNSSSEQTNIKEEGEIPIKKEIEQDKQPIKKAVKILVPSLSEFDDLNKEDKKKQNKNALFTKRSGLLSILPPPKATEQKSTKPLIPNVVAKSKNAQIGKMLQPSKKANTLHYDSNSDDEGDNDINKNNTSESGIDFFSLNKVTSVVDTDSIISDTQNTEISDIITISDDSKMKDNVNTSSKECDNNKESSEWYVHNSSKTLVSNVINLPKEEILIKNKAEVGPKLPIPEQEYNVDAEGNVAFDEKAIEYLCGRRGIKRKNKEVDEANIIEISGDDIKPDEREWLVKALTEEPVQRPISLQSSGINSQSKKKHQITYLAHQAKAMELELKNQWALNRMTRKQTQSKYGF